MIVSTAGVSFVLVGTVGTPQDGIATSRPPHVYCRCRGVLFKLQDVLVASQRYSSLASLWVTQRKQNEVVEGSLDGSERRGLELFECIVIAFEAEKGVGAFEPFVGKISIGETNTVMGKTYFAAVVEKVAGEPFGGDVVGAKNGEGEEGGEQEGAELHREVECGFWGWSKEREKKKKCFDCG